MPSFLDAVYFLAASTGTVDFVPASAIQGYQLPATAGAANTKTYAYRAESTSLNEWEVGIGTYSTTGPTLARTTVIANHLGTTAKVNFAAAPNVGIVELSQDMLGFDFANSFTTAQKSQARANLGVPGYNYVMNPSGEVAQIGYGYSQNDVTYDFDQWLTLVQTAAVNVTRLDIFNVGTAENGTPYMMRTTQSQASAQRFGRLQWIENKDCIALRGKTVALSARVRMSASTTLRYAIVEWTGTADAITKDIVLSWTNGTFTAGNFFTSTSTTVAGTGSIALTANTLTDITVLSAAISSSMNNLAVFFWTDSTQAQNVTLDIGKVKLEEGTVQTPFEHPDFQTEKLRCMRYFETSFPYGALPSNGPNTTSHDANAGQVSFFAAWTSSADMGSPIFFKVPKRASANVTGYGNSAGDFGYLTSGVLPTTQTTFTWSSGLTIVAYNENQCNMNNQVAQTVLFEIVGGWTAEARL